MCKRERETTDYLLEGTYVRTDVPRYFLLLRRITTKKGKSTAIA